MDFDTTRASADDLVRKQYDKMDDAYWNGINDLIKKYNIQPKDIILNYLAFIQRRDLPRLLAFYEIFQKITENERYQISYKSEYRGRDRL